MRGAFVDRLLSVAADNPRIWLLTGDLGYSVLEPFAERFPDRFVNVGVAEQNMVGVAAGLALASKVVFTYSIANFPTLRCLEQLRNDVAYHNLPVITVAVGGGLTYGSLGYTHHAVEDLAVMRSLPNMAVVAPGDPHETRAAVRSLVDRGGPGYLRLGKANEACVHPVEPTLHPDRYLVLREGTDVTLVATGGVLPMVVEAADILRRQGVSAEAVSLPFVNPLAPATVASLALRTGRLVSVEEHGKGGLGGALAEILCAEDIPARLRPLTLAGDPTGTAGSQEFLRTRQGLTVERIVEAARDLVCRRVAA
jgi:transketolase